jgi:hypothetical protein
MRVAATNCAAVPKAGQFNSLILDLLRAAEERLAAVLDQPGKAVRTVQPLQESVYAVGQPGQDGMTVEKRIEDVTVQNEDALGAALQNVVIKDCNAEQVQQDLGRAVVIAGQRDDINAFGQLADERQDSPVVFIQAAEVHGIEDVAIQDQARCNDVSLDDALEQTTDIRSLTVATAQVDIGQDDCIEHKEDNPKAKSQFFGRLVTGSKMHPAPPRELQGKALPPVSLIANGLDNPHLSCTQRGNHAGKNSTDQHQATDRRRRGPGKIDRE